jgi:hypothetical protein
MESQMSDLKNTALVPTMKIEPSLTPHIDIKQVKTRFAASFFLTPQNFDSRAAARVGGFYAAGLDISGSMKEPINKEDRHSGEKLALAKQGVYAFLDALSPTDYFAIYTFGSAAYRTFPGERKKPVLATPENIAAAKAAVAKLDANESTKIGGLLRLFREDAALLGVTQAYMGAFTDGDYNDHGSVDTEIEEYQAARRAGTTLATLLFGIGVDWNQRLLMKISEGTMSAPPDVCENAAVVEASFKKIIEEGVSMALSAVRLRITKKPTIPLPVIKIERPIERNLLPAAKPESEMVTVVNIGPMPNGEEQLVYIEADVEKPADGNNLVAYVVQFEWVYGTKTEKSGMIPVRVEWTDNESDSQVVARGVAQANFGQESVVRQRAAAKLISGGDIAGAEKALGELYKKALEKGDSAVKESLEAKLIIVDGPNGVVKLKDEFKTEAGAMRLDTQSSVLRRRGPAK